MLKAKVTVELLQQILREEPEASVTFSETAIVLFDGTGTLIGVIDSTGKMLRIHTSKSQNVPSGMRLLDTVTVEKNDSPFPPLHDLTEGG